MNILQTIIDQTGDDKLYAEQVLNDCYCQLFDYVVNGLNSGYDKELILKLSKEKLLQTKELLDNYCMEANYEI